MPTNGHDHEELVVLQPNALDTRTTRRNNNNNNNNNNDDNGDNDNDYDNDNNQDFNVREARLFAPRFYEATLEYERIIPRSVRRVIEFVFLFKAVLSFFILVYVHINFSRMSDNCFDHVKKDVWPRDGILRVEIIQSFQRSHAEERDMVNEFFTAEKFYEREYKLKRMDMSEENATLFNHFTKTNSPENKEEVDIEPSTEELVENKTGETNTNLFNYLSFINYISVEDEKKEMFSSTTKTNRHTTSKSNFSVLKDSEQFRSTKYTNSSIRGVLGSESLLKSTSTKLSSIDDHEVIFYVNYIVEYSLELGYLYLSPSARNRSGIPVMVVALEPTQDKCYGDLVSQFFLEYFLGYEDLLMLYVKSLSEKEQNKGFMRNVNSGEYHSLENISNNRMLYIASILKMVVFTLLSTTLLYYFRRLIFILSEGLEQEELILFRHSPVSELLTYFLVLFGLECIISQSFPGTLCHPVVFVVWIADQYHTLCKICPITKKHWLRFFYLYHFSFFAYHHRFNGQYSNLAFDCSCSFILHSMIYFYHNYVMPRVVQRAQRQRARLQRAQRPQVILQPQQHRQEQQQQHHQQQQQQQQQPTGEGSLRERGRPAEVVIRPVQHFRPMNGPNNSGRLLAVPLRRLRARNFEALPFPNTG